MAASANVSTGSAPEASTTFGVPGQSLSAGQSVWLTLSEAYYGGGPAVKAFASKLAAEAWVENIGVNSALDYQICEAFVVGPDDRKSAPPSAERVDDSAEAAVPAARVGAEQASGSAAVEIAEKSLDGECAHPRVFDHTRLAVLVKYLQDVLLVHGNMPIGTLVEVKDGLRCPAVTNGLNCAIHHGVAWAAKSGTYAISDEDVVNIPGSADICDVLVFGK